MIEDRCKQTSPRLQIYKDFSRRPKKWGVFLLKSKINAHRAQKSSINMGFRHHCSIKKKPPPPKGDGALGRGDAALSSVD